jgi:MFS family permease
MALSNAIVPVLPSYGTTSLAQGMIYSLYFFGAFLITLPAGILSDHFGRVPLIRLGLSVTVMSGLFLALTRLPEPVLLLRFLEGIGAGLFVAAAMSAVNRDPDHIRLSGWFMAFMNAGLVTGLVLSGWLAAHVYVTAGILVFAIVAVVPAAGAFSVREPAGNPLQYPPGTVICGILRYRWLWYSSIVLIGITGVVTSLYPGFSGASADILGLWIAGMSIATIAAVLIFSHAYLSPVPVIRVSALLVAAAVLISYWSAAGLFLIGALAGVVMLAQMAFLSGVRENQGVIMGLFSTTSYLGMAILPFAAGFLTEVLGYSAVFWITAAGAVTVAGTIGRSVSAE